MDRLFIVFLAILLVSCLGIAIFFFMFNVSSFYLRRCDGAIILVQKDYLFSFIPYKQTVICKAVTGFRLESYQDNVDEESYEAARLWIRSENDEILLKGISCRYKDVKQIARKIEDFLQQSQNKSSLIYNASLPLQVFILLILLLIMFIIIQYSYSGM